MHTINREVVHLTELKQPQATGSSSAQLSNEGHSCTSERYCCFTGTIKPGPALPRSTHCAAPTLSCATEPIGCYNAVADAAASGLFYSLSLFLPRLRLLTFLQLYSFHVFKSFHTYQYIHILENDSQEPCQDYSLGICHVSIVGITHAKRKTRGNGVFHFHRDMKFQLFFPGFQILWNCQ